MLPRIVVLGAVLALAGSMADAAIIEEVVTVPVEVVVPRKPLVRHLITVTVFRDDTRARAPFLVIDHGRAGLPDERETYGRVRFPGNARYFVARGFAVFVPTRIGYGVTGGPDLEDSGPCAQRDFAPAIEAAAQQTLAVVRHARAQAYVAGSGIVVGQSFGGVAAIAVAARNEPGVVAAINFAGGAGGRPSTHPGAPCRDDRMAATLAGYGASAKVPTQWLYSENDRYWGARIPKTWFDGFVGAGGRGRFVALPPSGDDGHSSFTRNAAGWRPAVDAFLRELDLR